MALKKAVNHRAHRDHRQDTMLIKQTTVHRVITKKGKREKLYEVLSFVYSVNSVVSLPF